MKAGLSIAALALILSAGCARNLETPAADPSPERRPLGREYPTSEAQLAKPAEQVDPEAPRGPLRLSDALAAALLRSPELTAFSWELRAAEARTLAAGARPNPELAGEVENFAGSGENRGVRSAEYTLALSQLVELGGKRAERVRVAQLERQLAGWDYEARRLDVLTTAAQAFVNLLAAQRQVELAEDSLELAQRVGEAVRQRVRVGTESPIEESRAAVIVANARAALERARADQRTARIALAATWGSKAPAFERAEGPFDGVREVTPLARISAAIEQNPDLARWMTEIEHRRAALRLEQAKLTPDLTVSAGVRRFSDTDDSALVGGLSIPLPIFGFNPGGVAEAQSKLLQAEAQQRGAEARITSEVAQAHERLSGSYREVLLLRDEIVPAAELAFGAAQQGYREGKFGLLAALDSQRQLIEARGQLLDALAEYHRRSAELERLVGAPLNPGAAQN